MPVAGQSAEQARAAAAAAAAAADTAVDVVVVGAGVSGLTAAYHLTRRDPNLRVVVVEAKDRVGGRTFLRELKAASGRDVWDFGGQWVGSCQSHVMAMLAELGLDVYRQYTQGTKIMQLGDNRIRTYKSDIPSLSFFSLLDLHQFISKVERWQEAVSVADPGLCEQAEEFDSMTVDVAIRKYVWTKAVRESLEAAGRTIWGVEPSQISMLYMLAYCHAAGGLRPIIEANEGSGQEFKIQGGAGQIAQRLAARLGQENIWLSQPIASINQEDGRVRVTTVTGRVIETQYVIMATPPHQTVKIHFEPALPTEKLHVLQNMPVGYITKLIITYQTAFWREKGFSGEIVTNGGPAKVAGVDSGPLCIVYDATSYNGNPALVSFIGGKQQRQYNKLPFTERKKAVLESLADYLGCEALTCLEYAEKDWGLEPYSGGGPVCVGTPGMMTSLSKGLRHPYNRVHFAGSESATEWCGFINGAIQAGYRAANEVLYNLRPQSVTSEDLRGTVYDADITPYGQRSSAQSGRKWTTAALTVASIGLVGLLCYRTYAKR